MFTSLRPPGFAMTSQEPVDWVLDGEFGGSRTEVKIENLKGRIRDYA